MSATNRFSAFTLLALLVATPADAAEICGNGVDDDADNLADEGCYNIASGVCESPLSCNETGMVAPLSGGLQYRLPPDVAPKVPYGPGIGLRRSFLSQVFPGMSAAPSYQAVGSAVSGTGTVSPAWPAHAANDVALLVVETASTQPASLSVPAGFVQLAYQASGTDTSGTIVTVYWKRATTSSEATPTVGDSGDHQLAQIITFRNVAPTGNPWEVVNGWSSSSVNPWFSVPATTTLTANTLSVEITAASNATTHSGWYSPSLGGAGERTDASTTQGNDGAFAILTGIKLTAGVKLASSGTLAVSSRTAAISLALRPVDNAAVWKKPLGDRWTHTYMTWLTKTGSAPSSYLVVRTSQGQDIRAAYASAPGDGWEYYTAQTGVHVHRLRQRIASPNEFELRMLTGETLVYNSSGRLIEIWDTLATPNKVLIGYDGNGQVWTVTDASGKRRLLFAYTGSVLTNLQFQVKVSGVFTTYHTTTYGYPGGVLGTITIGGSLAQTNVYSSGQLTQIQDGAGKNILGVAYNQTFGQVARINVPSGTLGYDYQSSRASCSGKTVLYFNLGNATSCSVDSDCGSGFLCGGKTGSGTTGRCSGPR